MERGSVATTDAPRRSTAAIYASAFILAALVALVIFLVNTPWYQVFLAFHILAAVVWVGGGVILTVAALMASLARDNDQLMAVGRVAESAGKFVFTPGSLVVLAFGFALVEKGQWGYDHFWVLFALIGWGFSAATGIFVLTPWVKKLNALAAELGPDHPRTQARLREILSIARADAALLLLIVADMAAKPFFFT